MKLQPGDDAAEFFGLEGQRKQLGKRGDSQPHIGTFAEAFEQAQTA